MKLTDAEWKIMKVLWDRHPASVRDVIEALEGETDWAYTTVKTMLTRLEEKGVVEARMRGNTAFYTPLVERKEARFSALRSLVDTAFDGTLGTMMHFLVSNEEIPEKDRAEILRLIRERKHQERNDK